MVKQFLLLCLFVFLLRKTLCSYNGISAPEVNYQMMPLQSWKVSINELMNLKEKLKVFIVAEIQNEGSQLFRKYFKEFELGESDEETGDINADETYEDDDKEIYDEKEEDIEDINTFNYDSSDHVKASRFLKKSSREETTEKKSSTAENNDFDFSTKGPIIIV